MKSRVLSRALAALTFAAGVGAPVLLATPAWASFSQCPAIGLDTGCAVLITINPGGSITSTADPSQGPYDGSDDTLVGVQNNSSSTLTQLDLASATQPIFGFEGDGLCTATAAPAGCPFGPTGYEGPGTSFTNISADTRAGAVVFGSGTCATGIPAGGSAYFSLEDDVDVSSLTAADAKAFGQASALTNPGVGDTGHVDFDLEVSLVSVPPNTLVDGRGLDAKVQVRDSDDSASATATTTTAQAVVTGPAGITINAEDIVATSTSSVSGSACSASIRSSSGRTTIGHLHVYFPGVPPLVKPVVVELTPVNPPAPNTTETVGGEITIVLDEQRPVPNGLAVCAVHIYLPDSVDTCISYAETDTT
jgi:hypothetical protein